MKKCYMMLMSGILLLTGCSGILGNKGTSYKVDFSVNPIEGGTVTAQVKGGLVYRGGAPVIPETTLVFTAIPATTGKGYYVDMWDAGGEKLKISGDRRTAELVVKKDTRITVHFAEYSIENANCELHTEVLFKDGTKQKIRLVISDSNTLTIFDKNGKTSIARITYADRTLSVLHGGTGSIVLSSLPPTIPGSVMMQFSGLKIGTVELENQTVQSLIVRNTDNFIR